MDALMKVVLIDNYLRILRLVQQFNKNLSAHTSNQFLIFHF